MDRITQLEQQLSAEGRTTSSPEVAEDCRECEALDVCEPDELAGQSKLSNAAGA